MFSLFHKSPQVKSTSTVNRADGYDTRAVAVVCKFQAIVERESDCDYEALSAALQWARTPGVIITLPNLWAKYNDHRYAVAQFAYSSR